jgi:hypothetical protein
LFEVHFELLFDKRNCLFFDSWRGYRGTSEAGFSSVFS